MDVALSGDGNVIKKEAEKILKYKDLNRNVDVITNVIPTVVGDTENISKSFR
jgi:hypothetical protein